MVLRRLGIGLPAFQIDGGLLLLVSYRMIFGDRPQIGARDWQGQVGARFRRSRISACHSAHGGPGALATILLLSGNALSIERLFVLTVVVAIVCAISAVDFSGANLVARTLVALATPFFPGCSASCWQPERHAANDGELGSGKHQLGTSRLDGRFGLSFCRGI